MGFDTTALPKISHLLADGKNRAWEVWDEPAPLPSGIIVGFRLFFPAAELVVRPEQRAQAFWKEVIYIEAAPPGKMTVLTVFVTPGEPALFHGSEASIRLASFDMGDDKRAQLIAHREPEKDFPNFIRKTVETAILQMILKGKYSSEFTYGYFLGRQPDGCRYIFGARLNQRDDQI